MTHLFVLDLDYVADLDNVERHLDAHREFLLRHYSDGTFLASGRKDPRTGGIIIARGDRATIAGIAATDPFNRQGVARYTITEFVPTMTADSLPPLISDNHDQPSDASPSSTVSEAGPSECLDSRPRPEVTVRPALAGEVAGLPGVQMTAGGLFRDLGMNAVADGPAPSVQSFEDAANRGDLLVAVLDDEIIGFVKTKPLDGGLHVEQISVAPHAQGNGVGRALMIAAEQEAISRRLPRITLTTFRDVPFNGPFYRRLGWRDLDQPSLSPGLRAERTEESAAGIDRWPRVAMAKTLATVAGSAH